MEGNQGEYKQFVDFITKIVRDEINQLKEWHLGEIESVIDTKKVRCFVDGSNLSQIISCNPDIIFNQGDHVWVIFINSDSKNKFVISKRAL